MANSAADQARDYNSEIINEFRANEGRVGGMWTGTTLILLHHIGARSGIERVTPVACSHQPGGLTGEHGLRITLAGGYLAAALW